MLLGLDHGVGHFRPLSITRHRHWLAWQTASEHCLPQCGIKPIVLDSRKY